MNANSKPDPAGGCGLVIVLGLVTSCMLAVMAVEVLAGYVK